MIRIIINEYKEEHKQNNVARALFKYFWSNNFRCRCWIRLVINTENRKIRHYRRNILERKFSISIGENTVIKKNLHIHHYEGIVIGNGVRIGENCHIYQNVTIGQKNNKYPIIGNNVTLYPGCVVIGDIVIGDGAQIAPNSVVITNIPQNAIFAGIPAKQIK